MFVKIELDTFLYVLIVLIYNVILCPYPDAAEVP